MIPIPRHTRRSLANIAAILTAGLCASSALQAAEPSTRRPVATYSIVARDGQSGELGVAVQSHWFAVGSVVAWAEPGVGAVATQSLVDPEYGPLGLRLMRAGRGAPQALEALLTIDEHPDVRQVAMVDANGNAAVHTGEKSIGAICDVTGDGFTTQANIMWKPTVCAAMATAFEAAEGDLAERLMIALEAAESEGGDARGKQSAAMLVVSGDASLQPWGGRLVDLRVEDHPEPLAELRRLLTMNRAYNLMNAGDEHMTEGDIEAAVESYAAAQALVPDSHEMLFWHAATLAAVGKLDEALPLFADAFSRWPRWRDVVTRLPDAGLLPEDPTLMQRILAASE